MGMGQQVYNVVERIYTLAMMWHTSTSCFLRHITHSLFLKGGFVRRIVDHVSTGRTWCVSINHGSMLLGSIFVRELHVFLFVLCHSKFVAANHFSHTFFPPDIELLHTLS